MIYGLSFQGQKARKLYIFTYIGVNFLTNKPVIFFTYILEYWDEG